MLTAAGAEEVSASTEEQSASAMQMSAAAEQLDLLAGDLQGLVAQFTLEDAGTLQESQSVPGPGREQAA